MLSFNLKSFHFVERDTVPPKRNNMERQKDMIFLHTLCTKKMKIPLESSEIPVLKTQKNAER